MATTECVAGEIYKFGIAVRDEVNPDTALENPVIEAADFFISINGGTFHTLDNAPTVAPAGTERIEVQFSVAETTAAGGNGTITLKVADASDDNGWIGGL